MTRQEGCIGRGGDKYCETHSIADYWDELEEGEDIFKRPRLTPVTLKFDPLVLKKIKMLANKRGISYNAYIRYLLAKSVERELLPG
jgi:predicted DNA binding CopG/RHH family protein